MLLQALAEYADRIDLPPALYAKAPLRYIVELDGSGRLLSAEPTDLGDPSSPRTRRGQWRPLPQVQRASGIKPLLLADNAEYTLGLARPGSKPGRVAACHVAYVDLVRLCARETGEPAAAAVQSFLDDDPIALLQLDDEFDRGGSIGFSVNGNIVTDLAAVQTFWAAINDPDADADAPAKRMQCLVCGRERPVLRRLQAKIKGVRGGQTSGTALISANSDAFLSYGLEASLIAPTCAPCGERFTKGLNDLLARPSNHIVVGGATFVFWTRQDVGFDFLTHFTDPTPELVQALYESLRSGAPQPLADDTAFYATELSGSGGRAVVRDWIDTTVGAAKRHLAGWFEAQQVVGPAGDSPRPFGLRALAGATVRELKDLPSPTFRSLIRAALTGTPLPLGLLYQAVRRNRAEQRVIIQRAALIKLVLRGNALNDMGDDMVHLNYENPNPGYRCGRLLAVLEEIQRAAIPGINATIVDRFYGTASSAPASVFSRLLRGAQPHLAKLERDRRGVYYALQRRLEDIQSGLSDFPRTLSLTDQGRFALGYYHQRALDRQQAQEAAARRRAGAAGGTEDLTLDTPDEGEEESDA